MEEDEDRRRRGRGGRRGRVQAISEQLANKIPHAALTAAVLIESLTHTSTAARDRQGIIIASSQNTSNRGHAPVLRNPSPSAVGEGSEPPF